MKKSYITVLILACITTGVYAANTLIFNIEGNQTATSDNSYTAQQVRTMADGDIKFMNKDNDTNRIGDYFSGYYYDSAYGVFRTDAVSDNVRIASIVTGKCPAAYTGYKLTGYSYNPNFGFMDFDYDTTYYTYVCVSNNSGQLGNTVDSYLGGYAYSPSLGFQNFDGITIQGSVVTQNESSLTEGSRQIKIIGLTSSKNTSETASGQFLQDVNIVGESSKVKLRQKIQLNVIAAIKGVSSPAISGTITNLSGATGWNSTIPGSVILGGEGRYFAPTSGGDIEISGDNLTGNKTLVVEGGNIYITGNIRGTGLLSLVALSKNGIGGNIYVSPIVTDIHAVMYADRSLISYNGSELDGSTQEELLSNQLYIKGSLFSENTLGGYQLSKCPFYVQVSNCSTQQITAKYDLNYLRRYVLVTETDEFGISTKYPQFNATQSYAGGVAEGSRNSEFQEYSVVIEYDSRVQQNISKIFR